MRVMQESGIYTGEVAQNQVYEPDADAIVIDEKELSPSVIDMLGFFVQRKFEVAEEARRSSGITNQLLDSQRRRKGEYDEAYSALLGSAGTSKVWIGLTETKCNAAEAWMTDIDNSASGRGFKLQATVRPDLGEIVQNQVIAEAQSAVSQDLKEGQPSPSDADIEAFADALQPQVEYAIRKQSEEKAKAMDQQIRDQLSESNWPIIRREFRSDCVTYGIGILKGPVVIYEKRMRWSPDTGEPIVKRVPVMSVSNPSPLDVYFSPMAKQGELGYVVERQLLGIDVFKDMGSYKGYKAEVIDDIIRNYPDGYVTDKSLDSQRLANEQKSQDAYNTGGDYEVFEYWGPVLGSDLFASGMEDVDVTDVYQYKVVVCCGRVIMAQENPCPIGSIPYHVASYKNVKGSIYGHGIPKLLLDSQDIANASGRSLVNNMGIASGPQCVVDRSMLPPEVSITNQHPFKVWITDSSLPDRPVAGGHQPVYYFQPNSNAAELIGIVKESERMADNKSGVPSYSYGSDQGRGAAETASGLSMLLNAAGRGIKDSIANMDIAIASLIKAFYTYNMLFNPDKSIKGDCEVVTTGTLGVLVQELHHMKVAEFIDRLNSPVVLDTVGPGPAIEALREYGELLQIDTEGLLPSREEIEEILKGRQQEQSQMAQAGLQSETKKIDSEVNLNQAKAEQLRAKAESEISDAGTNKARVINEIAKGDESPTN